MITWIFLLLCMLYVVQHTFSIQCLTMLHPIMIVFAICNSMVHKLPVPFFSLLGASPCAKLSSRIAISKCKCLCVLVAVLKWNTIPSDFESQITCSCSSLKLYVQVCIMKKSNFGYTCFVLKLEHTASKVRLITKCLLFFCRILISKKFIS